MAAVLDDLPECIIAQKKFVLIDPLEPRRKRRVLGVRKPFLGRRLDCSGGEPRGEDHADPHDESTPKTISLAVHGATLRYRVAQGLPDTRFPHTEARCQFTSPQNDALTPTFSQMML